MNNNEIFSSYHGNVDLQVFLKPDADDVIVACLCTQPGGFNGTGEAIEVHFSPYAAKDLAVDILAGDFSQMAELKRSLYDYDEGSQIRSPLGLPVYEFEDKDKSALRIYHCSSNIYAVEVRNSKCEVSVTLRTYDLRRFARSLDFGVSALAARYGVSCRRPA